MFSKFFVLLTMKEKYELIRWLEMNVRSENVNVIKAYNALVGEIY